MLTVTKPGTKGRAIVLLAMHNPFGLLNLQLLHALIDAGNRYFVRQTWQRGLHPFDHIQKAAFLFTHYRDLPSAQMHYNFLHQDGQRFLYDSRNPAHFTKLEIAARQVPAYPVYTPLLEKPWEPSEKMAVSIRRYIATYLNWHVPREEIVKADLFTQFGELFVNLKYKSQEAKIPLADIEKS
jgi:hypothetical protein